MLVFLIGPAAAGKTTVAHAMKEFDGLRPVTVTTDLLPLKELFELEEAGVESEFVTSRYWSDPRTAVKRTQRLPSGGYCIVDPSVWDACLQRVAEEHASKPNLVLEFARGNDPDYLAFHDIDVVNAYAPSFDILRRIFKDRCIAEGVIVGVTAAYPERMRRNRMRRARGEHFVADRVMETIYRSDCFSGGMRNGSYAMGPDEGIPSFIINNGGPPPHLRELARWLRRRSEA